MNAIVLIISIRIPWNHIIGFPGNHLFNVALHLNLVSQCYYSSTSIVDTFGAIYVFCFPNIFDLVYKNFQDYDIYIEMNKPEPRILYFQNLLVPYTSNGFL